MNFLKIGLVSVAILSAITAVASAQPSKGSPDQAPAWSKAFTGTCKEVVNREALVAFLEKKGMTDAAASAKAKELLEKHGTYDAVRKANCN